MKCKICSSQAILIGSATVLNEYEVNYFRCVHCSFIQTEKPYWLSKAYSESIARSDIGLIGRNITLSKITSVIITIFFKSTLPYLDYGGGNGMFVRLMRDLGYDFYWQDKYTINQFAVGFEGGNTDKFKLLTAFELFEHLEDPINEILEMLEHSENILFSTALIPSNNPLPGEWWYFALDTGQHISLYSKKTLIELAKRLDMRLYSNGRNLHLLTRKKIHQKLFVLLSIGEIASVILFIISYWKSSLLEEDYFNITGKRLK